MAVGGRTTLNDLFGIIRDGLGPHGFEYAPRWNTGRFAKATCGIRKPTYPRRIAGIGYVPLVDLAAWDDGGAALVYWLF